MISDDKQSAPGSLADAPASLKQRAYDELKRRILTGRLPPGMMLSERQLATELRMSKTPVHAALERLEVDGLVMVAAQQGILVQPISPQDIADHFEIREVLEPYVVAKLAAGRLTAAQAAALERNIQENCRAVSAADVPANVQLDADFHLLLCEFAGNREIARVMGRIREKVHSVIHHITSRHSARMEVSLAEHRAIADAILACDATSAADRMRTHLHNGLRCVYDCEP
jgi:DNA-binding GntR family transcriptional regulator